MKEKKEKYNSLLQKAYELEGLLHLALARDEMPRGLESMISRKADEICRCLNRKKHQTPGYQKIESDENHDEGVLRFYALHEEDDDEKSTKGNIADKKEGKKLREEIREEQGGGNKAAADKTGKTENKDKGRMPNIPARRKPKYSLNDKFLYTRELFKGDAGAFNKAIDKISASANVEEAEKYLRDRLHITPEGGETAEAFVNMVRKFLS